MDEGTETTRIVEDDGITVRKTVENDGQVRFEIDSERDTVATVRITDPTLDSRPTEEIEFHADHIEDWVLDDGTVFERVFDPEERCTVRYRVSDADGAALDTEPRISVTDGSNIDEIVDRARSDALREFVGGDRDSLASEPTATDSDPNSDGDSIEATTEEDAAEGSIDPAGDGERATADRDAVDSATHSSNVARVLLEELRNGDVDDETAAALRSELGSERSRSQDVRINHLQSEVGDLAAYTDTIESFIDRHGTFDSVVDDVHAELSALEDRTERVDSTVQELSVAVDRVDGIDDDLDEIRSVQSDLESELEEIRETQAAFESRYEGIDDELISVQDRLDDLEQFEERISGVFRDL